MLSHHKGRNRRLMLVGSAVHVDPPLHVNSAVHVDAAQSRGADGNKAMDRLACDQPIKHAPYSSDVRVSKQGCESAADSRMNLTQGRMDLICASGWGWGVANDRCSTCQGKLRGRGFWALRVYECCSPPMAKP